MKNSTEEEHKSNEILSIPNDVKIKCTFCYMIQNLLTMAQLLIIFATLDFFLVVMVVAGQAVGFVMFGFKRRKAYMYIYNPLGSLV